MDTHEFIALCDGVPEGSKAARMPNYKEECVHIKDPLTDTTGSGSPFAEFKRLRTGLIYLSIIDGSKDYSSYYYILEKVSGHFNDSTKSITPWGSQVWKDVIAYCKSLPEYPRTNDFENDFTRIRERQRAFAAKRLMQLGARPKVEECELVIENLDLVYGRLEQLMEEMGGINALHFLLSDLHFNKEIGRFLVPHQGNQPMLTLVELEKPYGYLFNLCIKHTKDKGTKKDNGTKWNEICEIATDLCIAVYDSQKFDIWSDVIFPPEEVVRVVHEMVMRFNIYTLPQINVSFTLDWCKYLCKQVGRDARCDHLLQAKLKTAIQSMQWAMNTSRNETCTFVKKDRKKDVVLQNAKGLIGDQVFVNVDDVNKEFKSPTDFEKVNCVRFPVVETEDGYWLLPKTLVVWNWCESILNIIKTNKEITKSIGTIMEDFVSNKMRTNGLIDHNGLYKFRDAAGDRVEGQVDFLLEANEGDLIIECKKKALTLPARAGDDYRIWGDLYDFIYSQMQCSRLENGVKTNGHITLSKGRDGSLYKYVWKNEFEKKDEDSGVMKKRPRKMVKATMTLKEYGPMQDKIVLTRVLKSLIGKQIKASFAPDDSIHNPVEQKVILDSFVKINKALTDLTEYYKAIGDKDPTFFCRFFSMEQLYFLIKRAKSQDDFYKQMEGFFVTTGTESFWNEYLNTKQIVKG